MSKMHPFLTIWPVSRTTLEPPVSGPLSSFRRWKVRVQSLVVFRANDSLNALLDIWLSNMGKIYESIDGEIHAWINKQRMFFVGTAPLSGSESVNISPKGHDTLRVLDEKTLAYLDYGGSGVETIAHVRENGRIVIMMCAFGGLPKIYRFHGTGQIVTPLDCDFDELASKFDSMHRGIRSIIVVHVTRISASCGYGVPIYEYKRQRPSLPNYVRINGIEYLRDYFAKENSESLDGHPGTTELEARSLRARIGISKDSH